MESSSSVLSLFSCSSYSPNIVVDLVVFIVLLLLLLLHQHLVIVLVVLLQPLVQLLLLVQLLQYKYKNKTKRIQRPINFFNISFDDDHDDLVVGSNAAWPQGEPEIKNIHLGQKKSIFPKLAQNNLWFFVLPSKTRCWCVLPCKENFKKIQNWDFKLELKFPKTARGQKRRHFLYFESLLKIFLKIWD